MLAALFCLGLASSTLADGQPHVSSFASFVGIYRDASASESRSTIKDAIDRATASMNFIARPIARERLKAINPAYATIRIVLRGNQLTTDFDGQRFVAPIDGATARNVDEDGSEVHVSYRAEGAKLHARYHGEDGEKRYAFELAPDDRSLDAHVTVLSKRLPQPVAYRIVYTRTGAAGAN
jgi:hypothetical protein